MGMELKSLSVFSRPIPIGARIKQTFPADHIENPRTEVREKLLAAGLRGKVFPGAQVAVTAGSRGMANFVDLVAGIVDALKVAGAKPFIIPAMGSHGGATGKGQPELLRRLGGAGGFVGAPLRATMETVSLGRSETGAIA